MEPKRARVDATEHGSLYDLIDFGPPGDAVLSHLDPTDLLNFATAGKHALQGVDRFIRGPALTEEVCARFKWRLSASIRSNVVKHMPVGSDLCKLNRLSRALPKEYRSGSDDNIYRYSGLVLDLAERCVIGVDPVRKLWWFNIRFSSAILTLLSPMCLLCGIADHETVCRSRRSRVEYGASLAPSSTSLTTHIYMCEPCYLSERGADVGRSFFRPVVWDCIMGDSDCMSYDHSGQGCECACHHLED